jgi:predicted PurR-regulated permease PerM
MSQMLGFDAKAARITWTVIVVLVLVYLVYLVRSTLFIFVIALLLAHLLSPLVDLIDRFLPTSRKRTRTPALALAYIIFVGAVVLVGVQFGSVAVQQAKALGTSFPPMIQSAITSWQNTNTGIESLDSLKQQAMDGLKDNLGKMASQLPEASVKIVSVVSNLIYLVIIPVLSFFFLKDGREMSRQILELVDVGPGRAMLDDVLADIHLLLAHYMRALMVLSTASFTAYGIFFAILGIPYGVLLAAMGGMLEFIPMIGPLVAGLIIVLVAGVTTGHVLVVVIYLIAYRMFNDYVLSPHLMHRGVAIHPLLALFGVFAGAEIAGIAGTFLSVPVLAMVRVVYLRIYKARLAARGAVSGFE